MALTINREPVYQGNCFLNMMQPYQRKNEEITQVARWALTEAEAEEIAQVARQASTEAEAEEITQVACRASTEAIATIQFWINKVMEAQNAITVALMAKEKTRDLARVHQYTVYSRWNPIVSALTQFPNGINSVGEIEAMAQMPDEIAAYIKDAVLGEHISEGAWKVYEAVEEAQDKSRIMFQVTGDVKSELPKMVKQVAEAKTKIQYWAKTVAAGRCESWMISQGWFRIEEMCQDAMKINDITRIDELIPITTGISQVMTEIVNLSRNVDMLAYPICCVGFFGTQMVQRKQ
jgi:hypothetical protein